MKLPQAAGYLHNQAFPGPCLSSGCRAGRGGAPQVPRMKALSKRSPSSAGPCGNAQPGRQEGHWVSAQPPQRSPDGRDRQRPGLPGAEPRAQVPPASAAPRPLPGFRTRTTCPKRGNNGQAELAEQDARPLAPAPGETQDETRDFQGCPKVMQGGRACLGPRAGTSRQRTRGHCVWQLAHSPRRCHSCDPHGHTAARGRVKPGLRCSGQAPRCPRHHRSQPIPLCPACGGGVAAPLRAGPGDPDASPQPRE